ncbi:MAG: peroxiredoxin family protein [Prevotella sp.]
MMKRTVTSILFSCLFVLGFAQVKSNEIDKAYKSVEATFSSAADVESLRDNHQFMSQLKTVVSSGTALSAKAIVDHSTFVFMNGLMADVAKSIEKMPKELKESDNGVKVINLYNSLHLVDVGMEAPDFTLPTPDGNQIHFKDFLKGKKCVLVDFWASWCVWCRKENPNVRAAYDEFKDKGFDVISVSVDTKNEAWRKALDEDKPMWAQVVDYRGTKDGLYKWYNLNGIPAIFLIDGNGFIVAKKLRGSKIRETVAEYLNNN